MHTRENQCPESGGLGPHIRAASASDRIDWARGASLARILRLRGGGFLLCSWLAAVTEVFRSGRGRRAISRAAKRRGLRGRAVASGAGCANAMCCRAPGSDVSTLPATRGWGAVSACRPREGAGCYGYVGHGGADVMWKRRKDRSVWLAGNAGEGLPRRKSHPRWRFGLVN